MEGAGALRPSPAASRHPLPGGEGQFSILSFSLWEKVAEGRMRVEGFLPLHVAPFPNLFPWEVCSEVIYNHLPFLISRISAHCFHFVDQRLPFLSRVVETCNFIDVVTLGANLNEIRFTRSFRKLVGGSCLG